MSERQGYSRLIRHSCIRMVKNVQSSSSVFYNDRMTERVPTVRNVAGL